MSISSAISTVLKSPPAIFLESTALGTGVGGLSGYLGHFANELLFSQHHALNSHKKLDPQSLLAANLITVGIIGAAVGLSAAVMKCIINFRHLNTPRQSATHNKHVLSALGSIATSQLGMIIEGTVGGVTVGALAGYFARFANDLLVSHNNALGSHGKLDHQSLFATNFVTIGILGVGLGLSAAILKCLVICATPPSPRSVPIYQPSNTEIANRRRMENAAVNAYGLNYMASQMNDS